MRRPLRRRVEPRPDETVASLGSRLAARNATTLRGFCSDMGMPLHAVHDGHPLVARGMAQMAGSDPEAFAAGMLTRLDDIESRDWSYRGQHLKTANLNRNCRRVCLLCLSEDVARADLRPEALAYARCAWRIRHLRTCMVHRVALVEVDAELDSSSHYDTAQVYQGLLSRLLEACRHVTRRDPSGFESYLTHRFEMGAGGIEWLDRKPMWAATIFMERVGTADLFGRSPNLKRLSPDDWWNVGRAGFDLLKVGPEGIMPVLDVLHDNFKFPDTGRNAPGQIYGHLWRWVDKVAVGPEFDDVRDLMREHAISRLPLPAGTEVLGQVLERRRVHSLYTVSVETGRHVRRLRKVFESHGLLPAGHAAITPNRLIFDAEQVAPLLANMLALMRTSEVLAQLGVARVQSFVREGLLTPVPVSGRKAGQHEFARDEFETLMADLHQGAEPLEAIGRDQIDLVGACSVATQDVGKMVALVRRGFFGKVWRLNDGKGLRSVVLLRSEVRALEPKPNNALATYQVVKRLQVQHLAVQRLIAKQILPVTLMPSPRGRKITSYVTEADLTMFQNRYVSLFELAQQRSMSIWGVKRELVARGVEPILPPEEYGTSFYLRSDI